MAEYEITLDDILKKDGGQAYMESVYKDLWMCFKNTNTKISLRDDDSTASAGVFRHKETDWWMLKDFGGGGNNKAKTALQVCMEVNNLGFGQAMKVLAEFYGVSMKNSALSAKYNSRAARGDEQPNTVTITKYKDFTQAEVLTVLSVNAWKDIEWGGLNNKNDDKVRLDMAVQMFAYYHFKSVDTYEQVSSDGKKVNIFSSTEQFPIFAFDETDAEGNGFQKIYKPKDKKEYRFLWAGKKPENFWHGLAQHKQYIQSREQEAEKEFNAALEAGKEPKRVPSEKLREIILVSGGSDALNVAAMGYRVIWGNSETAKFEKGDFKAVMGIAKYFYNLPDIDMTGKAAAKALAFRYLDVRTIWLPATLSQHTDMRGNACKDVRDYLKYYDKKAFRRLVDTALPFKFWDEMPAYDKEGNQKMKFGRPQMVYELNHVCAYNFLEMNGFYRYPTDKVKEGYIFTQVDGNVVKKVEANIIKNFIHTFLKERQMPEDLRNVMYKSPQLSETSLSNIEEFRPNFKHFGKDYQYVSFEKSTWKVTADGVEKVKSPDVYVWNFKIIKFETTDKAGRVMSHDFKPLPKMFEVKGNKEDGWDIDILNSDSDFFKFMINSCRIHWRKELEERMDIWQLKPKQQEEYRLQYDLSEKDMAKFLSFQSKEKQAEYFEKNRFTLDGDMLFDTEVAEQKLAVVNRIFCIGYLLHRYKDFSKPWAVFMMDYRISEEGASNGRAGKGILAKALYRMLWNSKEFPNENVVVPKDGRKPDMFDYEHIWEPVERWVTDLVHIEDWSEFQDFTRLFTPLTSMLNINPKGKMIANCIYPEYGKFLIDTNFADRYTDSSSMGRKLHTVFADYYHEDTTYYREKRTPFTELGRQIFDDWDEAQWNMFYNFMMQCLSFYLSVSQEDVKIEPPFTNINKRNNLSLMGENFKGWADNYFNGKLNEYVPRTEAYEDCKNLANVQKLTPQGFISKLRAWCEFNEYVFNPEDCIGWHKEPQAKFGKITQNIPKDGKFTSKEFVFIKEKGSNGAVDRSDIPM